MRILVTGGAGYIGSHTVIRLLESGYQVTVVDNLSTGHYAALQRIEKLTGKSITFHRANILDRVALAKIFSAEKIDAVIHFAALKSVEDSVSQPGTYYLENVGGTAALTEAMQNAGVTRIVYSSTCQVYGDRHLPFLTEALDLQPVNPYGDTKTWSEHLLRRLSETGNWSTVALRYFNPIGAHDSGEIGEDQRNPKNIIPILMDVIEGKRKAITVFGTDYNTHDGTCIRDYIHIVDLANAHIAAVEWALRNTGALACNIGTGKGGSVFDVIQAVEAATGATVPYVIGPRRAGDPEILVAHPELAKKEFGWSAQRDMIDMARTAWNWRCKYPNGYADSAES